MEKGLFLISSCFLKPAGYILLLAISFLYSFATSYAEEKGELGEIIVTATKIEETLEETTSSVIVVKGEDIKKMNVQFVPDILRKIPELNLVQNGGNGEVAGVLLRGGDSTHTLVLIDGVKVNSTTVGSFDFSGITVDDIERIEIVEGPQSTIYGSEAMAGVINIITKKGKGKPRADASFEAGSFGTYKPAFTFSGGDEKVDYRMTTAYYHTGGISAAKGGAEKDAYNNASISGKFGFRPSEKFELEVSGKYYYDSADLDSFGADALNYVQHGNHHMLSGRAKVYLLNNWEQVLTASNAGDSLRFRDPVVSYNNADIISAINAVEWQHNLYLSKIYTVTAGAEYRKEKGENKGSFDRSVNNRALYINNKLLLLSGDVTLNAGLRYDDHETFGGKTTYRVGAIYNVKPVALRVRASYGTGFRAPTLNELFYSDAWGSSGNPNLKPERSSSWEIGVEKDILKDRATVSVTYFDQMYKDLIQWVEVAPWTYSPMNVAEAEVRGVEANAKLKLTDSMNIKAGYTHLDTQNKTSGLKLERRPGDKFNLAMGFSHKDLSLTADFIYVGGRFDDASNTRKLAPYNLVNLSGSYVVTKNLSIFARADNVFNKDYEEASGYGTPGFSMYGGIKISL